MSSAPAATGSHTVVVNEQQQYSLWPADRQPPLGWAALGRPASEEECLAYIAEHWTDLRPLAARRADTAGGLDG
ncbi:MbtH family protein [Kitasatospora sp. NPDC086801]|uniref:MbtH family protein n=1 Tax=Kitasatospora sp. NPDC086801 TaxID=3364066 RepID=UPI003815D628